MQSLEYVAGLERAASTAPARRLTGKVALVTGSSRGIGRAIAHELAACGATVVVNCVRGLEAADDAVREIESLGGHAVCEPADVSDLDAVSAMVQRVAERVGPVDVLVNNAGILRDRTFKKLTPKDWAEVIQTNLYSVFNCTYAVLPSMLERKWGRIVNISSFVGQTGNFGQTNYAAAKAGIIGFTKSLALETAKSGITVNAIAAGFTETEMWSSVPENVRAKILERIPMGRVGTPQEIAACVRFLVCEGSYITGQSLNPNGGIVMP